MESAHDAWLKLTPEAAIGPDLPICDAHHHFWDHLDDRYFLDELLQDIAGGHRIVQTVFIECLSNYRKEGPEQLKPVGETEFVEPLAVKSDRLPDQKTKVAAGIVGYADLMLGAGVVPVLEAHLKARRPRFSGIP